MKSKIAIIGDGGWGTALAMLLYRKGHKVSIWGVFKAYVDKVNRSRINTKFLPDVRIPLGITLSNDLGAVVKNAKIVVLAVPSKYLRNVLGYLREFNLSEKIILSTTKGVESKTLKRASQIINNELGRVKIAVLSGPTIAREVARGIPTAAVIASKNSDVAKYLQNVFTTDRFRVYTSSDLIGVELGGSLKNIIAIACGISDGLGFGTNTKAAILARGLIEMARLGKKLGATPETFSGISGLGDLVTTCISKYSRNRFVGEQIGRGKTLRRILKKMQMVAEGVTTVKSVYNLSMMHRVDMPITQQVYQVLYKNKNPRRAVDDLMHRKRKREFV
jgi:glycerol-3-phosphate dehydrogenase (NAD(P)+)